MTTDAPACGCPSGPRPRVQLLGGELGISFAVSGLVVHGDVYEARERLQSDREYLIGAKAQRLLSTERHEYVHYLQAVGSLFLQLHVFRQLQLAVGLLREGPRPDLTAEFRESQHRLSTPSADGLTCMDLLESGAVLEGYKLDRQDWGEHPDAPAVIAGFPAELQRYREDGSGVYHRAFDWLEQRLGLELAYRLFMPLSFIAFNTPDPVARFTAAAHYLGRRRGRRARAHVDLSMADMVARTDIGKPLWLAQPGRMAEVAASVPTTVAAFHMVEVLGLEGAVELLGRPWRLDRERAPVHVKDAVAPLALAWSSASGLVEIQCSDLTANDTDFLGRVFFATAALGAADRLCAAREGDTRVYRFCPHRTCPHYGPALCHRYYLPRPLARHHDTCNFVDFLAAICAEPGVTSEEIWRRWELSPDLLA